jgi:DNA-directed RNA polymerase sigma subunit (sigma70/sigma32)
MTYDRIADIHSSSREKIKKTETSALRKLRRLLGPQRDDLMVNLH